MRLLIAAAFAALPIGLGIIGKMVLYSVVFEIQAESMLEKSYGLRNNGSVVPSRLS